LLNKVREESEQIIDALQREKSEGTKKPRKDFLKVSKIKNTNRKTLQKTIRQQPGHLGRNL